jgi:hypothetical protein
MGDSVGLAKSSAFLILWGDGGGPPGEYQKLLDLGPQSPAVGRREIENERVD